MSIFHKMFMAASGAGVVAPTPELADPYFDNVELLLHGDGTSGSTTFTDSSPDPKTFTVNGNTQIDTAVKKFGTGSIEFDGNGDYLELGSDFGNIGASGIDYTIEAWIYITAWPTAGGGIFCKGTAGTTTPGDAIALDVRTNAIYFHANGNYLSATLTTSTSLSLNTWYHVVASREGNVHRLFLDGALEGSTTQSYNVSTTTNAFIGTNQYDPGASNRSFYGYIDDLRITKGVARYTSDFNPPDVPHPDIGSDQYFYATKLLIPANGTNGSTTFTDESSNPLTITANGNAQISTAQSKFGGSSGYFDGSGDYLSVVDASMTATAEFTVEGWFYSTSANNAQDIFHWSDISDGNDNDLILETNGSITCRVGSGGNTKTTSSAGLWSTNTWHHFAVVRNSSNNVDVYLDGSHIIDHGVRTDDMDNTLEIGRNPYNSGTSYFIGYIDEFRITKGVARYTSDFTAPRIEHPDFGTTREAVSITANGTAQISTAQSKFGGSSGLFDGNSDYLSIDGTSYSIDLSGDFTIEFFVRHVSATGNQKYLDLRESGVSALTNYLLIDTSTNFRLFIDGSDRLSGSAGGPSADTWYHIAVVRNGTSIKYFLDGTEELDYTQSTPKDYTLDYNWLIAINGDLRNRDYLNGYLDELRFSSTARYTSNFTAPTSAFDNDSDTLLLLHMDNPNSSTTFIDDNGLLTSTE